MTYIKTDKDGNVSLLHPRPGGYIFVESRDDVQPACASCGKPDEPGIRLELLSPQPKELVCNECRIMLHMLHLRRALAR